MERRSAVRQALFTNDFLQSKYPHIFKEAAALYNELNANYPRKPDLRKCREYMHWKNSTVVKQGKTTVKTRKPYKYCIVPYDNIAINPDSPAKEQPQKIMQLNIELMPVPLNNHQETVVQESNPPSTPQESNPPSTPEEQPLPEPTEADIEPYRPLDKIPPAIVEKIISELRLDPQLSAIMDDVETGMQEQSLELDIPELEIDIPELERVFDQDDVFW